MKNTIFKPIVLLLLVFLTESLIAQPPPAFYVQNVAKDNNGNPARNRTIHIRFAIYQGAAVGGTMVYDESHRVQSNNDGVYEFVAGRGQANTGTGLVDSLQKINWGNGPFFSNTKIAIAPSIPAPWWIPANNYVDLGTSQLLSVPYAMYAGNASVTNVSTNITPGPLNTFLITDSLGNVKWTTPQAASVNAVTNINVSLSATTGQDARIAPNTTTLVAVQVQGVKIGDPVLVTALDDYTDWAVYSAFVKQDGFVHIRFANFTANLVNVLGSQYKIVVIK